jgi:hypothetical protein
MSGQRNRRNRMRFGLFLPLFDPLADPAVVARLAGDAEEVGWDGFFIWDQIGWREPVAAVGDTRSRWRRSLPPPSGSASGRS